MRVLIFWGTKQTQNEKTVAAAVACARVQERPYIRSSSIQLIAENGTTYPKQRSSSGTVVVKLPRSLLLAPRTV